MNYYTLMRFATCASFACLSVFANQTRVKWFIPVTVIGICGAILFNPFAPFHMKRKQWQSVDAPAAAVLIVSACLLTIPSKKPDM